MGLVEFFLPVVLPFFVAGVVDGIGVAVDASLVVAAAAFFLFFFILAAVGGAVFMGGRAGGTMMRQTKTRQTSNKHCPIF